MNTPKAIFTSSGVDISENARSVSYLMGISDFFHSVFEDKETTNTLLEANAITASEIYSNFLQLTSSLSLETIQSFTGVSIKLIFLGTESQLTDNSYKIDKSVVSGAYLTNRPYLPTETLEKDVHFSVDVDTDYSILTFARPLDEYQFSQRVNPSGQTEYAIWMVNAVIDSEMVQRHFGNVIGADPEQSSEQFSNFIYGLYYLYSNGPTLDVVEKGANLTLGIPLARDSEKVIDIRTYLDTDQVLVITDKNQYLLPEGVAAAVDIEQELVVGDLIAKVVELSDYVRNGNWWIQVAIPRHVIAHTPESQKNRYATNGTFFFDIMKNHLFRHTFLVRVNVGVFRNNDYFAKMLNVITRAKPAYTQPIYTWRVYLGVDDGSFGIEEVNFDIDVTPGLPLMAINFNAINETVIG